MSTFKVGETAIGVCHDGRYDPDGYHGAEVTIIGGLAEGKYGVYANRRRTGQPSLTLRLN